MTPSPAAPAESSPDITDPSTASGDPDGAVRPSTSEGPTTVVFVCTHNSARSQMAEGYLRATYGDRYDVYSAGTEKTHVRPLAIQAMEEIGIDISGHTSKTLDALQDVEKDYVVTVCDSAREACPVVRPREMVFHQSFPDPSAAEGSDEERLAVFRSVRDELTNWIDRTFGRTSGE